MECISRSNFGAIGLIHYLYHFVIFILMSYVHIKEEWKLFWGWLILVILLLLSGCASTNKSGEEETHYPLLDTSFKLHKYKHNIQWVLFVKNNPRTEYCSVHFKWEDIQPLYRPSGNGEYRWVYRVNKNKRSWK